MSPMSDSASAEDSLDGNVDVNLDNDLPSIQQAGMHVGFGNEEGSEAIASSSTGVPADYALDGDVNLDHDFPSMHQAGTDFDFRNEEDDADTLRLQVQASSPIVSPTSPTQPGARKRSISSPNTSAIFRAALPPQFYGREEEINSIREAALEGSPVAILGGAGNGKSTIARRLLHDPQIQREFTDTEKDRRFFVNCDTIKSFQGLSAKLCQDIFELHSSNVLERDAVAQNASSF
ncbi:hypothetical protein BT69DRAFT_453843 [Atractiella rhizophila]|nr:hypothetical protein BT69DRAFT_453843 [Atractiella rhizophila]